MTFYVHAFIASHLNNVPTLICIQHFMYASRECWCESLVWVCAGRHAINTTFIYAVFNRKFLVTYIPNPYEELEPISHICQLLDFETCWGLNFELKFLMLIISDV